MATNHSAVEKKTKIVGSQVPRHAATTNGVELCTYKMNRDWLDGGEM